MLLGGGAVWRAGSDAQREAILPKVIGGDMLLALAYQERSSRYALHHVATRAERAGDGWRISGEKHGVLDGHVADRLIVSARSAGTDHDRDGVTLFLVDAHAPGVSITRQWTLDGRNAAIVRLRYAGSAGGRARRSGRRQRAARRRRRPRHGRPAAPRCWAAWKRSSR